MVFFCLNLHALILMVRYSLGVFKQFKLWLLQEFQGDFVEIRCLASFMNSKTTFQNPKMFDSEAV
jgi:hypothetical protein